MLEKEYEGAEHNKVLRAHVHAQHTHTIPRQDCGDFGISPRLQTQTCREKIPASHVQITSETLSGYMRSESKHKPSLLTVQQRLLSLFFCHDCVLVFALYSNMCILLLLLLLLFSWSLCWVFFLNQQTQTTDRQIKQCFMAIVKAVYRIFFLIWYVWNRRHSRR